MVRSRTQLSAYINRQSKKKINYLDNKTVGIKDLTLPEELKIHLDNNLKHIIDPQEIYYKKKEVDMVKPIRIKAIHNTEYDSNSRNLIYDPILENFTTGVAGVLSNWQTEINMRDQTALAIRGLATDSQRAIKHCQENNIDFYAIDTGYMQPGSKKDYHRITKNSLQNLGPIVEREHDRLRKLNWRYKSHKPGEYILVVPPSEKVMKFYGHNLDDWMKTTVSEIKKYSNKPINVRLKPSRTERVTTNPIQQAMNNAYCVITYNSIAATEALLYGVPAIALAPNSARMLCNTAIEQINNLYIPNAADVTAFAAHLSYCQFTSKELLTGYAWSILNESN